MKTTNMKRKRNLRLKHVLAIWLMGQIWIPVVHGQIGVSICACQPGVYTFEINFAALCINTTVIDNDGVKGIDCFQRGIGSNAASINDTIPVQINSINILELDANRQTLAITPYEEAYQNGDTFVYTSPLIGTLDAISNLTTVPSGLQMTLNGINRLEEPITNVWIIIFDNDCQYYPVLSIGDNIGWTTLIDVQQPFNSVCPLSQEQPSDSPSSSPVVYTFPSVSPSTQAPFLTTTPSTQIPTSNSIKTESPSLLCIPQPSSHGNGKGGEKIGKKSSKGSKGKGKMGKGKNGNYPTTSNDDLHYDSNDAEDSAVKDTRRAHKPSIPYCPSEKQTMEKKSVIVETNISKRSSKLKKGDVPGSSKVSKKILKSKKDGDSNKIHSKKKLPPKYDMLKSTRTGSGKGGKEAVTNLDDEMVPLSSKNDGRKHFYWMKKLIHNESRKKVQRTKNVETKKGGSQQFTPSSSAKGGSKKKNSVTTLPVGKSSPITSNNQPTSNAVKMTDIKKTKSDKKKV